MSLGTIILILLLLIMLSVVPIRPKDQSCLMLEKFKRKKSLMMHLMNKRFLTVIMLAFVLLLTNCRQDGAVERAGMAISNKGESASVKLDDFPIELEQQGLNSFYGPELKSSDDFREMVKESFADLKVGFGKAGVSDLLEEFVKQAEQQDIREIDVNPGVKLQWMIFRKGPTIEVVRDVVWDGKEPFAAFLVNVDKAGVWYTFVIAAKSGNVFLALPRLMPVVELVPNDVPFCMVAISPIDLSTGEDVTVDASQSTDPDGTVMSMLVQVEDENNALISKDVIDKPPFIERLTMVQPGNYSIRVSVTDDKGKESYSPGCPETKVFVTAHEESKKET